jgi:hypothetical protein
MNSVRAALCLLLALAPAALAEGHKVLAQDKGHVVLLNEKGDDEWE